MSKKTAKNLREGSILRHLINLVLPSIGGMAAITAFNLTDTYFVSKLGTNELAAMGFTFPVVMLVGAISTGISVGAASLTARSMGEGNYHLINRTATDGILLSLFIVSIISGLGLLTIEPFFGALGATGETLDLIREYMLVWYSGIVFVVMPPVCDSCMRALGDMKRPLIVMLVCAITNVILDPIFIFGWFGVPAMGIKGAAIATVIARFIGMIATLSFAHFHHKIIDFKYESKFEIFQSWKKILHVGIPSATVKLFPQALRTLLTSLAAKSAGVLGVAAVAAGARIESFSTVITMAVGIALVPIIGQNWGAKEYDRVNETNNLTNKLAIIYGIALATISLLFTKYIARAFTQDLQVINYIYIYVNLTMLGSIGFNLYSWISESLNAIGAPKYVLAINALGTLLLMVPSVYIGYKIFGYTGMLVGLAVSQTILGIIAVIIGKKQFNVEYAV